MLKTRIIPCMLYNGFHLVKTIKFGEMRNLGSPLQTARVYNARDVDELIFIDLTATEEKRPPAFELIKDIIGECFMPLTIGGGVHYMQDVDKLMKIGADKVVINTEAINNPAFISEIAHKYGSQSLVVSVDVKKNASEYNVYTNRGKVNTKIKAVDWVKKAERLGAGEIFLNSIDNDGVMEGYDIVLIKKITKAISLPVIACGGAGKAQDLVEAVKVGGASAVSLSSLLHYTENTPNSIKEKMSKAGIPVRLIREHYQ